MNGSQRPSYVECRTHNFCGTNPRRSQFSPNSKLESIVYVLGVCVAAGQGKAMLPVLPELEPTIIRCTRLSTESMAQLVSNVPCPDYRERYAIHFTIFIIINLYHTFAMALLAARAKLMKLHINVTEALIHAVIHSCARIIIIIQQ